MLPVPMKMSCKRAKTVQETTQNVVPDLNEDQEIKLTFAELCDSSASLCPESWCSCVEDKCVSFCKLGIVDGQGTVLCSLNVDDDLQLTIFYKGEKASMQRAQVKLIVCENCLFYLD